MGKKLWGTPSKIATWERTDDGRLLLPRGATALLRSIAAELGEHLLFRDARVSVPVQWPQFFADPKNPEAGLRPYQARAQQQCLKFEQGIVRAPTGCLSGDTLIGINRGGKSWQIKLVDLVHRENGGDIQRGHAASKWDPSIPTTVRTRASDGFIRLAPLRAAYSSGAKPVFLVTLEDGRSVKGTLDHRFLTPEGWATLGDLRPGRNVFVEGHRSSGTARAKRQYRVVSGLHKHPYAGRRGVKSGRGGWSVPLHRLVVEAHLNAVTVDDYIAALKAGMSAGYCIDPAVWAVHHLDMNPLNNAIANLALMTHDAHRYEHSIENTNNVQINTVISAVQSIESVGVEETYDLTLDEPHNFLANGIVVHNSGKTHTALSVFAAAGQRTLVIMRDRQLLEQWVEKAGVHLGMRAPQIGIVQGSRRKPGECLTVALQQTLWSKRFPLREFAQHFGAIGVDEVQGAAATTVQFVVDAFPARYRFGFSADETRADGKEFLIYDLFGSVLDEVSREEVERDGFTCPVIVRLVPTDFEADWYLAAPPEERDFAQLIDTMISDPGREGVLLDVLHDLLTQHLVPIFVFTHRRQHAEKVAQVVPATMDTTCGLMMGGEESVAGFGEARDALRAGLMKIAVGTFQAIGTGIDIPGLFAGVVSTPLGKKNRQFFNQVRGRICRPSPGKKVGYLYYLWDRKVLPAAPRSLLDWNDGKVEVFDAVKRQWTLCDSNGDPADDKPKRKRV